MGEWGARVGPPAFVALALVGLIDGCGGASEPPTWDDVAAEAMLRQDDLPPLGRVAFWDTKLDEPVAFGDAVRGAGSDPSEHGPACLAWLRSPDRSLGDLSGETVSSRARLFELGRGASRTVLLQIVAVFDHDAAATAGDLLGAVYSVDGAGLCLEEIEADLNASTNGSFTLAIRSGFNRSVPLVSRVEFTITRSTTPPSSSFNAWYVQQHGDIVSIVILSEVGSSRLFDLAPDVLRTSQRRLEAAATLR